MWFLQSSASLALGFPRAAFISRQQKGSWIMPVWSCANPQCMLMFFAEPTARVMAMARTDERRILKVGIWWFRKERIRVQKDVRGRLGISRRGLEFLVLREAVKEFANARTSLLCWVQGILSRFLEDLIGRDGGWNISLHSWFVMNVSAGKQGELVPKFH